MKNKISKYETLTNILIIVVSSLMLRTLLEFIKVSGETNYTLFAVELSVMTISYLTAYFGLISFLRGRERILNFASIIAISVLGSFLFAIYNFAWRLYIDWSYISKNPNDLQRHVEGSVFIIFALFFAYSIVCSLVTGCVDVIITRLERKDLS
jgi:hypothetical protein